ncbi:MAG TPA: hypothetical protein DCX25_00310 [Candidatus Pacebacteria bacterium]|nr:MAG: hypothetical protein UX00_C0003G0047 [Microgenomates group bacterium GW2011_GWB1_45_17]KKU24147.1 MAG: hypothetical protein UX36_C0002G0130 [Microgenomates group bacterium GW2011_GWC1_46_15]KKU24862.1 MAG: hypothetical protein UX35_C0001G0044 [Microgenomates group bacterium GW2011_GWA1_46_15]HAV14763.1 hypothetical protein [Candidatus Paceibacterota bacterium]HCR11469.1 hypothetical protein [Candidatus Paceibacterota bacterium]
MSVKRFHIETNTEQGWSESDIVQISIATELTMIMEIKGHVLLTTAGTVYEKSMELPEDIEGKIRSAFQRVGITIINMTAETPSAI